MNLLTTYPSVNTLDDTCPPSELDDPVPPSRPSEDPSDLLLDNLETSVSNDTERFTDRKRDAVAVSKRFKRIGMENRGRKIGQCSDLTITRAFSCGHSSRVRDTGKAMSYRCKDKFCPICNHARSIKLSHRLGNSLEAYTTAHNLHTYHLVLTFKNSNELPDYRRIRKLVKRLFNSDSKGRKAFWDRYGYHGALLNFEITVDRKGKYHPHFHVLLITERPIPLIEQGEHAGEFQNSVNQEISDLWLKITGDSYIVKGKGFEFSGMFEMVKYMTKGTMKIPDEQLYDLAKWSEGKRFLSLIGKLYSNEELKTLIDQGDESHDPETCPQCGCSEYVDIPAWYDPMTARYVEFSYDQERSLSPP